MAILYNSFASNALGADVQHYWQTNDETGCRYGPDLERDFSADPKLPILDQSENSSIDTGVACATSSMQRDTQSASQMRLYDRNSERLYLNALEFNRFVVAAQNADPAICRFALTLAYTGCRLSEARALRANAIQLDARVLSIRSLKKREVHEMREVPLPLTLARAFEGHVPHCEGELLWGHFGRPVPRITAYRWIKQLMAEAGIEGARACPRGLRHAYGTRAVMSGIPLHMLQLWMGHASMKTTAIYATVLGPEQIALADRMWKH